MKTTLTVLLLVVTELIATAQAQTTAANYGTVCNKPASPLYETQDANKPLEMQMIVDYKKLNQDQKERGVISVVTAQGHRETLPVLLAPRGKSRRDYCQALPLRMLFLDQAISKRLSAKLRSENLVGGNKAYLKRYLELLNNESIDPDRDVKGQKDSLFEGLGDDVKIVTHCGASKGFEYVGGLDDSKQDEKLMSEFYIYQILGTLKMPVETARLAKIEYINADGSPVYMTSRLAFFREPPTSVAKRCGLRNKPPKNGVPYGSYDSVSAFQANFMNAFTANNDFGLDGHNTNNFYDEKGYVYYGPYDFDLSGIIEPTYFKNKETLEAGLNDFMTKLKEQDKSLVLPTVERALAARSMIQNIITKANLTAARRTEFQKWFKLYFDGLETYKKEKSAP